MTKRAILKLSKTDAAKRQLETAIRLWFFSGDPVSIHSLTAAAHQILHDIGKKRGVSAILRDLPGVRPERKKELRGLLSSYENFFKHADRDPDSLLNFNPEATELFMLDAVFTYESLTHEMAPILSTFKAWMLIHNHRYMQEEFKDKLVEQLNAASTDFKAFPKAEFFTQYQTLLMRLGVA